MMGGKVWSVVLVAALVVVAIIGVFVAVSLMQPSPTSPPPPTTDQPDCPRSNGLCVEGVVTRVIDGDGLEVEGDLLIRLVLVDAPELNEQGGNEARNYLANLCLGSMALIDEDDFQIGDDPYGRLLAVVYCNSTNANAAMISSGYAKTYYDFCGVSEFGSQAWTGCSSQPPPTQEDCDPAYPDVCIPSPPPDLDCADISYRNFLVLPPDPHNFDGDGDGVGCET